MRLVLDRPDDVIEAVAARVRHFNKEAIGPCAAIGFERGGELIGGVLCSNLTKDRHGSPHDMEFTVAFDNPGGLCGPSILRALFGYVFGQVGCWRVTTYIASDNPKSFGLAERMGFLREGCLRDGIERGVDLLIYGLKRSDCRFWRAPHANGQFGGQ